jgi:hypothetical protein
MAPFEGWRVAKPLTAPELAVTGTRWPDMIA